MQARLCDSVSGRYRTEENFLLTKHVVAAGKFAKDAGSTPAASTILRSEPTQEVLSEGWCPPKLLLSEGGLCTFAVPSFGWQALKTLFLPI